MSSVVASLCDGIQEYQLQQSSQAKDVISHDISPDWQPTVIAGFDCQWMDDRRYVASMVVMDGDDSSSISHLSIRADHSIRCQEVDDIPYISGTLGMREVSSCLQLLSTLPVHCTPHVLMVD